MTWKPHTDLVSNLYLGDLSAHPGPDLGPGPWVPTHMTLRKVSELVTPVRIEIRKKVADGIVTTVSD